MITSSPSLEGSARHRLRRRQAERDEAPRCCYWPGGEEVRVAGQRQPLAEVAEEPERRAGGAGRARVLAPGEEGPGIRFSRKNIRSSFRFKNDPRFRFEAIVQGQSWLGRIAKK